MPSACTVNWSGPNKDCVVVEMVIGTLTAAAPEIATDGGIEQDVAMPELAKPARRSTVPLTAPGAGACVSVAVACPPATIAATVVREMLTSGPGATKS